ncbi:MAG: hemerythrin domain-containing protein [Rhodospirillales bacterium]|nr:hemerythrin domain-containing protein [Rhodospirillales bacterium]MDP6643331.1 hemerythrin domain-containing protein [Rhodospirillales bacterium]MDP6840057.1 hemerythrin domain-containing protein [Rhodospirillales bacterium]
MKLTDALRGEHAVIYQLFDFVRETVAKSDDIQDVRGAASVLEKLIESHAQIEDDLLFPRLEPFIGEMGPLAVMRSEHSGIRDFLEAARRETEIGALKSVLGGLLDLAHGHFQKEEMALFAMAEQFLDEAALTELGDEWAARRNVAVDSQGCMGAS